MAVNFFTYRKPILSGLLVPRPVFITIISWWLIFYSPNNVVETIFSNKLILLALVILKEVFRTKKVWMAAEVGFAIYEGHIFLASFIGLLGAVGGGFVMNTAMFFTQSWSKTGLGSFRMSVLTKLGLLFSFLYVLEISGTVVDSANNICDIMIIYIKLQCGSLLKTQNPTDEFARDDFRSSIF